MYEATQNDLEQFIYNKKIDAFKRKDHGRAHNTTNNAPCRYCGRTHSRGKQHCSGADSTCNCCNKKGHTSQVCRTKDKDTKPERQEYHELQFNAIKEEIQRNDEIHTNVLIQNT